MKPLEAHRRVNVIVSVLLDLDPKDREIVLKAVLGTIDVLRPEKETETKED